MKRNVLFCAILLFVQSFVNAQNTESLKSALPVIDKICKDFAEKNHLPSLVYGLVIDGQIIHSNHIGIANTTTKTLADGKSVYRIASMSKSFTAMAILQLRDAGKLKLDEPVSLYIPEIKGQKFSADSPEITIRHLLTHAAGFPEDNPWGDRQLAISDETMLKMFKKGISFSNTAGVAYEYSNMGFAMLGYIIKKVSGQTYQNYINQHILKPLGMNDTYWDYTKVPKNQLAVGYRWMDENWVEQPMLGDGAYGAMGGMLTTIDDFGKYLTFHLSASVSDKKESPVLKRSSLREMHQPWNFSYFSVDNKNALGKSCPNISAYGYGLRWVQDCNHITNIGHSGGLPGFGSNWKMLPEFGIGIISFANRTYAPASALNTQILDTLIALTHLKPKPIPVSAILKQRQNELMSILPSWQNAEQSGIFAENFFLDYFVKPLRNEAEPIFANAGKILKINEMIPENNLRGYFIVEGENANIKISFTLSPEKPALIQEYHIQQIKK
ncbi:CubicO group peptidase (beta-lactamase class C family) [Arcicella aurantiaca]|uniref:CubicO group peptidase (Beta-lactamase class C family) n=1 Tax=Arcicella aurantiaca TaxID=591202 RepID=A0A316EB23_9BACT|nr:serine hydrolase domain-containing protein [Arcicella aurantiaca]PWK26529.1 CubicO group peptidase (beta-lactamase class C family) [Arcicella aurantiaca]